MADAVTRSHLPDGRVVGWYGDAGVVIDAELRHAPPPRALASRFGETDFWSRWTRAECAAKLADVPMQLWLRLHGLDGPGATTATTVTVTLEDAVISVARPVTQPTA